MINKRLIKLVPESMKHVKNNVVLQIISLLSNIVMMFTFSSAIADLIAKDIDNNKLLSYAAIIFVCIIFRVFCVQLASRENYKASKSVKGILRAKIYDKVIKLGNKYNKKISTAELLQLSVDGVEQLETYFGSYLSQFFYSMIAPLILFVVISFINFKIAIVLLICVPLIPVSIIAIQKFAKKLLGKYWGEYAGLADNFLENLQGLNTLKIYSADDFKHKQMNAQAERFRVVTMKVLSMQLNSIIVMDIVAYGGAALGIILCAYELMSGSISFENAFVIIMLCADFFLPLRILGSFFHIAMNGMTASKKIFELLDMEEEDPKTKTIEDIDIKIENLSYSYDGEKQVLGGVDIQIPKNSFVSVVGKSGCGKSTIAGILTGSNSGYGGSVKFGEAELCEINEKNLAKNITLISANSYIFKGTIKENLLMAKKDATDEQLWAVLTDVNLADFAKSENGLDTKISEKGENFSGGQCQRLALARALLHDTDIYIFDEATSNIDAQSEKQIMEVLHNLTKTKTVILISHRLINVVNSDMIYILNSGKLQEQGSHEELMKQAGFYENLFTCQRQLENI